MVVFMYTQALHMNQIITNDIKRLEVFKINKEDMKIIVYIASTCTQKPEWHVCILFRNDTAGGARNKAARAMSATGVRTRQIAGLRGKRSKAIGRKPGKLT